MKPNNVKKLKTRVKTRKKSSWSSFESHLKNDIKIKKFRLSSAPPLKNVIAHEQIQHINSKNKKLNASAKMPVKHTKVVRQREPKRLNFKFRFNSTIVDQTEIVKKLKPKLLKPNKNKPHSAMHSPGYIHILKENIGYMSIGLTLYLIFKNLIDLTLKHLVYLLASDYFSFEYLFICLFGVLQSVFLFAQLHDMFRRKTCTDAFYLAFYTIQLTLFLGIGCVQFLSDMTIWDHKYFLNEHFFTELVKYLVELTFVALTCLFKYMKLYKVISF